MRKGVDILFLFIVILLVSITPLCNYAQSPTYLTGNKTGNIFQAGSIIGLGTGNANISTPMLDHRTPILNTLRFYYGDTILSTSGSNPTTITASRLLGVGGLVGSGADAYIQFRTTSNQSLASGVTTYFKIGTVPTITGLSTSVGGLLGLSNVYNITGRGYSGAGNYVLGSGYTENNGTAAGTASGTTTEFLVDKQGVWYIAITPDASYNAVRLNIGLSDSINLVSLSRDLTTTVYNASYYTAPVGLDCGVPLFSSIGEVSGVNLNLGSVTSLIALDTAISNPQNAIDEDTSTYSRITAGALGIASSVKQSLYYHGKGNSTDVVKIRMSLPLSALTVSVLTNITVTAYNGTTQVGTATAVSDLLSADILGLLGDNTPFYINYTPGGQFDRVDVTLGNMLNIGSSVLGGGVRIYETARITNAPQISAQPAADTVCEGETAVFDVTATGDSLSYQWQYKSGSTWVDVGVGRPLYISNTTPGMDGRIYRVLVSGGACSSAQATYYSDNATLNVNGKPSTPPVVIGQ